MAKRRRLIPTPQAPETKEARPGAGPQAVAGPLPPASPPARPPVAQVAGDAAGAGALQEMAAYLSDARARGLLLVSLPLGKIEAGHLERDRLGADPEAAPDEDMAALLASLRVRGQQVPIDVVRINRDPRERYGLISGMRRLTALRRLHAETGEERFAQVVARIIEPSTAPEAYRAMVEENEIRAGISFYERARIVVKAVEAGAFPDRNAALKGLFGTVSRAKRSKIGSFVPVVEELGAHLRFPAALSEKRGLALAKALDEPGRADALRAALAAADPGDAAAEHAVLDRALRPSPAPTRSTASGAAGSPRVRLTVAAGRVVLDGPGVDAALARDLAEWLAARGLGAEG